MATHKDQSTELVTSGSNVCADSFGLSPPCRLIIVYKIDTAESTLPIALLEVAEISLYWRAKVLSQ